MKALYIFLTSALDGDRWSTPCPGRFTHCIGGWVGPTAGLHGCETSRLHRDWIPGPSRPQRVAVPTTLFRPIKAIPIQSWTEPEVSMKLIFPDFKTIGPGVPYWMFLPLKIKLTCFFEMSKADYPLTRRHTPAALKLQLHSREKLKNLYVVRISRVTYLYRDARLTKWKLPTFSHKVSRLAIAL